MAIVTMRQLLESGVHFGHQTRRWNPKMKKFIFTDRSGIYIIDLKKTVQRLEKAYQLIVQKVQDGESVLFVGTKKQAKEAVTVEAQRCGMHYVTERWLGGMLTNFQTIRRSLKRLEEIEKMSQDGSFEKFTKKEVLKLEKERKKLEKTLGGIRNMSRLPGVVYVVDTKKERIAVAEARRLEIPIVAILDTNSDPDLVEFPIPGNDDAIKSIKLISKLMADAVLEGAQKVATVMEDREEEEAKVAAKVKGRTKVKEEVKEKAKEKAKEKEGVREETKTKEETKAKEEIRAKEEANVKVKIKAKQETEVKEEAKGPKKAEEETQA